MKQRITFIALLTICLFACSSNKLTFKEVKEQLFVQNADYSQLPIYADPPTNDFSNLEQDGFMFQIDSTLIREMKKFRKELEPLIIEKISNKSSPFSWAYLTAYMKYDSAIPIVKDKLLSETHFYGWEGYNYNEADSYFNDDQYPYQMAYIAVIEYIANKPLYQIVKLSQTELKNLELERDKLNKPANISEFQEACLACWKISKFATNEEEKKIQLHCITKAKKALVNLKTMETH